MAGSDSIATPQATLALRDGRLHRRADMLWQVGQAKQQVHVLVGAMVLGELNGRDAAMLVQRNRARQAPHVPPDLVADLVGQRVWQGVGEPLGQPGRQPGSDNSPTVTVEVFAGGSLVAPDTSAMRGLADLFDRGCPPLVGHRPGRCGHPSLLCQQLVGVAWVVQWRGKGALQGRDAPVIADDQLGRGSGAATGDVRGVGHDQRRPCGDSNRGP